MWPYAKIIAIFWLVIPRFDGAGIAYNCFVRPCLSGQLPQVVLVLLNKNQDPSLEEESFPVPAQRDIIEHGGEALEELISTKVHSSFLEGKFSMYKYISSYILITLYEPNDP